MFVALILAISVVRGSAQAGPTAVRTDTIVTRDGVRIAYDVRGHGPVALVFLHCWACNRAFWRQQADVFAASHEVVTIDLAGHGDSGRNRAHWSISGLADDVVAVVDHLALRQIIFVGHSMGGPVALEAVRRLRGRVVGVVLVDTLHDVSHRRTPSEARADADQLRRDFKGYFADLSAMFSKSSSREVRSWVEQQAQSADPPTMIALKLDTPNQDPVGLLEHARVPIRAINARPPLSDATNTEENKRHADYEATLIDDAGHFLILEQPRRFNAALEHWISSLTAPS